MTGEEESFFAGYGMILTKDVLDTSPASCRSVIIQVAANYRKVGFRPRTFSQQRNHTENPVLSFRVRMMSFLVDYRNMTLSLPWLY